MKYKVNLKKTDEGYAVWVPGLPEGKVCPGVKSHL